MELAVNMYVRTKDGVITKIKDIDSSYDDIAKEEIILYETDHLFHDDDMGFTKHLGVSEIKKSSHELIDLVEVGDLVNGEVVKCVSSKCEYLPHSDIRFVSVDDGNGGWKQFWNKDIKTIVTHEQLDKIKYEVIE